MLDKQIKKFINGDQSAFEKIYNETRQSVYYVALGILKDRHLAEDVMQSTYLSVLRNITKYELGTNASAWIIRIARNEALNLKKQRSRENLVDERENDSMFGTYHQDEYGHLIDIARKILTEEEFTILMLITAGGYKRREIAEIFDCPVSTVTWKYGEALKKMRKSLEQ